SWLSMWKKLLHFLSSFLQKIKNPVLLNTMLLLKLLFWGGLFTIFFSYVGYGALVWVIVKIRSFFRRPAPSAIPASELPEVTLVIAAYNEASFITEKMENSCSLLFPSDKLKIIVITDGSTDDTALLAGRYKRALVLHQDE